MTAQPTGVTRASSGGQVRLMTKIAHLYHEQGLRQSEIAAILHISQAKVSRLLKRAAEVGIVRTVVVVSQGVHTDLEQALEERYGLLEAVVADVDGDEAAVLAGLGSAGASYLEATLSGGERIGVSSWSQTLLSVVDRLRPLRTSGADSVVQLVGGVGVASVQAQANRLLGELASLVGASPTYVPAPGLVGGAAMRQSLLADPAMENVAAHWTDLTMALVGIGSLQPSALLAQSGNAIAPADQAALLELGAVGDVCTRFFDADGHHVHSDLDSRIVGIDPETYRAIPRRVGLAGGTRKHDAIRAAIAGNWVNVVVTDLATARALLDPR
ncbi:MAG TPA: sugar-binding domain-containing protein [Microlunatus sp.]|nr:sugar-binding domain-containing protein [Microlunatus sp.]